MPLLARFRFLAPIVTVTVCVPRFADAQSSGDLASRRLLLQQAEASSASGDHAHALEFAQAAGRIEMTPSVRMFIAEEQAALGQVAPALGSADLCVRDTDRDATARNRDEILARCRTLREELRGRVGRLIVHVPMPRPTGLHVMVSGQEINEALFDLPSAVSPGTVHVTARADDGSHFESDVEVAQGASRDVMVMLTGARPATATAPTDPNASLAPVAPTPPPPRTPAPRPVPAAPIVLASVGVVTLGLSAVMFVLRGDSLRNCQVANDTILCATTTDIDHARAAPGYDVAAWTTLGVGLGALAAGATWFAVSQFGPRREAPPSVAFDVRPFHDGAWLGIGGAL